VEETVGRRASSGPHCHEMEALGGEISEDRILSSYSPNQRGAQELIV